eukprot:799922-Rhodomonas_salina.1
MFESTEHDGSAERVQQPSAPPPPLGSEAANPGGSPEYGPGIDSGTDSELGKPQQPNEHTDGPELSTGNETREADVGDRTAEPLSPPDREEGGGVSGAAYTTTENSETEGDGKPLKYLATCGLKNKSKAYAALTQAGEVKSFQYKEYKKHLLGVTVLSKAAQDLNAKRGVVSGVKKKPTQNAPDSENGIEVAWETAEGTEFIPISDVFHKLSFPDPPHADTPVQVAPPPAGMGTTGAPMNHTAPTGTAAGLVDDDDDDDDDDRGDDDEDDDDDGDNDDNELFTWELKSRATLWRDFAVLKTVSHLMQWGAHKQARHRALAIFWGAYYLWLTCLTEAQQTMLPLRVWYVFVFREYYMDIFPGNTWFSHDSLTLEQLTNVNVSMQRDADGDGNVMRWFRWVREQLLAMQGDMMRLSAYVFEGDMRAIRHTMLMRKVLQKDKISWLLDTLRATMNGTQALYARIDAAPNGRGLSEYFRWYMFTVARAAREYQDGPLGLNGYSVLQPHSAATSGLGARPAPPSPSMSAGKPGGGTAAEFAAPPFLFFFLGRFCSPASMEATCAVAMFSLTPATTGAAARGEGAPPSPSQPPYNISWGVLKQGWKVTCTPTPKRLAR